MTRISTVSSTVCSGAHQRKYQNSASLALVRGTPLTKVDSPHKRPVARKMFGIDDVFMRHITARPRTSDMGCSMYDLCSIFVILCYSVSWLGRVITKLDCIINISLKNYRSALLDLAWTSGWHSCLHQDTKAIEEHDGVYCYEQANVVLTRSCLVVCTDSTLCVTKVNVIIMSVITF